VHHHQNTGIQANPSVFPKGFNTPWTELPKALFHGWLFLEFNPISFRVLRIAETNAIPLLGPVDQLGWGQKPSPMAQEILIIGLEVLGFEAKMDRVDLMMSEGISGWTNRVNIVNQFKLMLTPVIAKEDKLTTHSIYAGMVTPWRCRHFCLSYYLEADYITVEGQLFIQISNDQTRVL
jgi:hypothetical protein